MLTRKPILFLALIYVGAYFGGKSWNLPLLLRVGKHYADEFGRLVKLAVTIQYLQTSNLDRASIMAQLRAIAEEAKANLELELELDQIRQLCTEWLPQLDAYAVIVDEIEPCSLGLSTTTLQ